MHSWIAAFVTFVALAHGCSAFPTSLQSRRSYPALRGGALGTKHVPLSPCLPIKPPKVPSCRRDSTGTSRVGSFDRRIRVGHVRANAGPVALTSAVASASSAGGGGGIRHLTEVLRSLSSTSTTALHSVTERAISTPPVAYLLALLAAGFGAPVSEDALCVFAGTVLPRLGEQHARLRLLACLYLGVTLSDAVTFGIGRALRLGLFEPVRRRFFSSLDDGGAGEGGGGAGDGDGVGVGVGVGDRDGVGDGGEEVSTPVAGSSGPLEDGERRAATADATADAEKPRRRRKRDVIREKMETSGDHVGFVARLSVGMRGPLMLLAGFAGTVSLPKFFAGSLVGALVSLPAQLAVGYCMRDKPDALVAVLAGGSTFAFAGPVVVAVASWLAVVSSRALGGAVAEGKGKEGGGGER